MTDDEHANDYDGVGAMNKLERIRYSASANIERWAKTDDPKIGVAVSLALAIPGVLLWYWTSGIPAALGVAWVIINLLGPVKWVMGR